MNTFIMNNEKYSIVKDPYCWILSRHTIRKKGKYAGEERIGHSLYFSKLRHLAEYLLENHVEIMDINNFNKCVSSVTKTLIASLCEDKG